jgi:chemotaxis protein methyltransferase CheR
MKDEECVHFLQEILPRLDLRWAGYRRVYQQVCKRLRRRIAELELPDLAAYQHRLEFEPDEWHRLEGFLRIGISRFYRDRRLCGLLAAEVLPAVNRLAVAAGAQRARIWSAGCAAGEEPYTLALIWYQFPSAPAKLALEVIATDADPARLRRARTACYGWSSLKELPEQIMAAAFSRHGDQYCLRPDYRQGVRFLQQDIRQESPPGSFHLVACRNLAFTYFAEALQRQVAARLAAALVPGGYLLIGAKESLPAGQDLFVPLPGRPGIFKKRPGGGNGNSSEN